MEDIRAVYDWKTFLRGLRPVSVDKNIKKMFSIQLKVNDDATVHVRSKKAVSAAVPFSRWYPMVPHPSKPDAIIPHREIPVKTEDPKEWTDFDQRIVPNLLGFYRHSFPHPCHIPFSDQREMLQFLNDGPSENIPPEWIPWGDMMVEEAEEPVAAASTTTVPTSPRRGALWRPFLQPRVNENGKTCRCGSRTHLKITHRACPLNPGRDRRHERDDEDQDDGDDEVTKRFPYSVGTWVAFEFHEGIFAGTITEVFDEDAECQVTFTDGDKGDYDADEICYAIQLYQVKFGKEKTNIP